MDEQAVILSADRGVRIRTAIPALVFIAILAGIALWLSIAFGPVGFAVIAILIAAGVVVFLLRTTSVALSVSDDEVIVRNTLSTTRVPRDEVEGMALTPDGELQVLAGKRVVSVEAADGRAEEDLAIAAEHTMAAVEGRPLDEGLPDAPSSNETEAGDGYAGDPSTCDA